MKENLFKLIAICCFLLGGLTSASAQLDCDCDFIDDPVCVEVDGEILTLPNACLAICFGFEEDNFIDCGTEEPGGGCDCGFEFEPVCVETVEGDTISFPNTCLAACEGYEEDAIVECPDFGDWPGNDCDCDWEFEPVCVVTVEGDTIPFPSACFAACEGYGEDAIVECPDYGDWPGNDCDCDLEGETVCVLTAEELICVFPNLCYAECAGYTIDDVVECDDEIEPPFEDCNCEFDIDPVCVEVDGEVMTFLNACLAECFGYGEDVLVDCGIDEPGNDCDCDWELDPVCVVTVEGDTIPFPNACIAACEGYGEDAIVECPDYGDWPGNDCDCELEGETVCVLTAEDLICVFPNLCFAECAGYTIDDVVECEDELEPPFEDCDCEFDIDPVCVDIDGEVVTFPNACFAECFGFGPDQLIDCGEAGGNLDDLTDTQAIDQEVSFGSSTGSSEIALSEFIENDNPNTPAEIKTANLYPNPIGRGALTIEFDLEIDSDVQISLMCLNGKVVQVTQRSLEQGSQKIQLNSDQLTSGIYFAKIETAESVQVLKFVKE